MPLTPPIQIRFTPQQLAVLGQVRETTGISFGEQIRAMLDWYVEHRADILALARPQAYAPLPGEVFQPPLPVVDHAHRPKVRKR